MREALRGLSTRGRSFLAAAVAAAISAVILGEKDLLRVAVLLAVLPLLAAAYVGRSRYKLACTRSLEPQRVPVGSNARVVLRLQNMSRLPTGTLMLEDRLPYALGSRPRVVLERLGPHQASSVGYSSSFLQDSDTLIGIEPRENEHGEAEHWLKVLASRVGPLVDIQIDFDWHTSSFTEYASQHGQYSDPDEEDDGQMRDHG